MIRASPLGLGFYRSETGVLVKLKKYGAGDIASKRDLVATTAMAVGLPRKQIQEEETHTEFAALAAKKNTTWNLFVLIFHGMCPEAIMDLLIDDSEDEAKAT